MAKATIIASAASIGGLTLALVIGSALVVERLLRLLSVDVGFDTQPSHRQSSSGRRREPRRARSMTFYSNVIREFERSSGIQAVVFSRMPLDRLLADAVQIREGAGESAREFSVRMRAVSPKAFRLIGVPVVAGREFADDDGPGVPRAAMVNETLAKRLCGQVSPLGRIVELSTAWGTNPVRIGGVVRDFRDHLSRAVGPEIYVSAAHQPFRPGTIVIRRTL